MLVLTLLLLHWLSILGLLILKWILNIMLETYITWVVHSLLHLLRIITNHRLKRIESSSNSSVIGNSLSILSKKVRLWIKCWYITLSKCILRLLVEQFLLIKWKHFIFLLWFL